MGLQLCQVFELLQPSEQMRQLAKEGIQQNQPIYTIKHHQINVMSVVMPLNKRDNGYFNLLAAYQNGCSFRSSWNPF